MQVMSVKIYHDGYIQLTSFFFFSRSAYNTLACVIVFMNILKIFDNQFVVVLC